MSLHENDKQRVIKRYQERISQAGGVSFETMASGSIEKQMIRHQIHASALRGTKPHVLDIGCGLAQFYDYLLSNEREIVYSGYDIVPEYIEACKSRYPNTHFELRNIFEDGIEGQYDTIVMSQVLNNRYQDSSNLSVMESAMRMAYQHSRVSVSIDMMSNMVDYESPELYYYDPSEILRIARTICRRVVLRHDYRPFEFSIQLYHDDVEGYVK